MSVDSPRQSLLYIHRILQISRNYLIIQFIRITPDCSILTHKQLLHHQRKSISYSPTKVTLPRKQESILHCSIHITHKVITICTVIIVVNQLVSTFAIFSFEGEGVGQSESYVNLVFYQTC